MGIRSVIDSLGHVFNPITFPTRERRIKKVSQPSRSRDIEGSDDPTMEQEEYSEGKREEAATAYYDQGGNPIPEDDNYPTLDVTG